MSKKSHKTNWHEAIYCAIQIDLRDYSHLLEYKKEYTLSANNNRMDMLIIKKKSDFKIPKHIASIFRTHNIFENKGAHASLTKSAYYKTNGHAGYYINLYKGSNLIDRRDITLTFPTFRYPRKLFTHLTKECNKTIDNPFPGVYYILNEMYATQVLVMNELSPEDSLFLHCLAGNANDMKLINNLANHYQENKDNLIYTKYMNQFVYSHMKGDQLMVCEAILNYFGTSSEEIEEKTRKQDQEIYEPQIQRLTLEKAALSSENTALSSENTLLHCENDALKQLLKKHGISY